MKVIFTRLAERELEDSVRYYELEYSGLGVNDHLIEPPMIGLIEPLSGGHFWLSDVVNF